MDGTLTFRRKGKKSFNGKALPAYSVDSEDEAKTLIQLASFRSYDGRQMVRGFLQLAEEQSFRAIFTAGDWLSLLHRMLKREIPLDNGICDLDSYLQAVREGRTFASAENTG